MSRILAIDYGEKRTGIAISDELQMIANSLSTVATKEVLEYLQTYIKKEKVSCIVIGYLFNRNRYNATTIKKIDSFIARLNKVFPTIKIVKEDERFTSVLAKKTMIEAGIKKKQRQNKALVDKISATILLQSFLDRKHNMKLPIN